MKQVRPVRRGFTIVELLVVIAIIAILIGLLLPSLTKAKAKSNQVVCQSNLRQVGLQMLIYADSNNGFLFPDGMGWQTNPAIIAQWPNDVPPDVPYADPLQPQYQSRVWPSALFGIWNPPILLCPTDEQPFGSHSYLINEHMAYYKVKYGTGLPPGTSPSTIVLMGEKTTNSSDYYMEYGDFASGKVEEHRHGLQWGSNYLFLDLHVDTNLYRTTDQAGLDQLQQSLDPWDFNAANNSGAGGPPVNPG